MPDMARIGANWPS